MKIKLLIFCIALGFIGCSGGPTVDDIQALADAVYNDDPKKINAEKAQEYVDAITTFASTNPDHEKTPEFLFTAAETARNIDQHDKALEIYDLLIEKYASYPKAPQALFLKAFTLDDNMNKKEEAKVLYEEFIKKYPKDDFAESAEFMLKNLYKSDTEIIEEFERKRQEGAVSDPSEGREQ